MTDINDNHLVFTANMPVVVEHLNYGNHLGYHSILTIIQEARMRWLRSNKMEEMALFNNIGYLIVSASVEYKAEAFHGDNLEISIFSENIKSKSFELSYIIKNIDKSNITATAKTGHIFYDFSLKKIARIPPEFSTLVK